MATTQSKTKTTEKAAAIAKKTRPRRASTAAVQVGPTAVKGLAVAAHKVSAAARARAESLIAEIARRKERIAEDFYEVGLALRELSDRKLFSALDFASFDALLTGRSVMAPTTARRLIKLVSSVSRDEALAYGQEKAIALIDYARATEDLDTPKTLVTGGTLPSGKKVADASVRELKDAAAKARKQHGSARPPSPELTRATMEARALRGWLRARGAGKATVDVVRAKGGPEIRIRLSADLSIKLRAS